MEVIEGKEDRYYTKLGRASDYILRCKECKRLVLQEALAHGGGCVCGHRKFTEIIALNHWEVLKIKLGLIRFPCSQEMLAEFGVDTWGNIFHAIWRRGRNV